MRRIKIYAILALAVAAVSCQNKDLHDMGGGMLPGVDVSVRINWQAGQTIPYINGMRINIFSLDPAAPNYGKDDVPWNGASVRLRPNVSYKTYAYNYIGNNIQFRNESDPALIEATSSSLVRATYSRAFPDEPTINSITGDMHLGVNPSYTVSPHQATGDQYIDVYPESIIYTYTYEIRGITGAQFIRAARGGISGFSASYFFATGLLSTTSSTVLFDNASVNVANGTITGSFKTFGRLNTTNNFTVEILFPSNTPGSGIVQETWDVTVQINNGTNFHIVIDNSGIVIPDEGGEDAGGWQVDLNDWNTVNVPLN